jgi:hypothetical protein
VAWQERGAFPGLGAMLEAMNFKCGELVAKEIKKIRPSKADFQTEFYEIMNHPRTYLPAELVKTIRKSEWQTLLNLSGDRKRLFWLLARITLSADCLSDREAPGVPYTVFIDESSMLTEEMFAALIQALKKAQRIVFVGDPNQLPPIGAGRPFVDLVKMLTPATDSLPLTLFSPLAKIRII